MPHSIPVIQLESILYKPLPPQAWHTPVPRHFSQVGWAEATESSHCIWKRQPETADELEQSFAAFDASEVGCYRYAGNDPTVMNRIGLDFCDHAMMPAPVERRGVKDDLAIEIHFSLT